MHSPLRIRTKVLPGKRIEISDPGLPDGAEVEVIVLLAEQPKQRTSMLEFLESLPSSPSPRAFKTWEEYEQHLQEERNSWERS